LRLGGFALKNLYHHMTENEISNVIVESAIEVHRTLGGPGLLESVYEEALAFELTYRGLSVERQLEVPISYKGNLLSSPLRLDLLVNGPVIVEAKALAAYNRIFASPTLTYLRLMNLKLGIVINFGESRVVNVVNGL
jgi:GxxExxY protein